MRILWLSANKFGYELLLESQKIIDKHDIENIETVGIITLGNTASTRMYDAIDPEKSWYDFGCPVFKVDNINNHISLIEDLQPDLIIMCGWRQIIKKNVLKIPPKGVIGFHPTLLPFGRGPAPIINTILLGVKESGVTMYFVDEGTDTGDIIGQEQFFVNDDDYAMDLYNKIIISGKKLIKKYLPLIAMDSNPRIPQNNKEAFIFPKRNFDDNEIDLIHNSPDLIMKKIRAFSEPYDGAHITLDNKKIIFWKAEIKELYQ
ncbi:formyltransferase family protein [Methanogenium sp. MK-MG]|uniref:formyltransferase family protein n=1 Tax=Methanogenium sp. MK-MG TaxID=2599926 RepID=UPI0013EA45CB|nr:formyltransferase family protein [Methanogenium sp. MK-MG]KAF1076906.1 Methionyl-tRNA formyltransferase [Methanogenium sp. MK-MG]